ncbi:MAG: gamma-glutamyl-gamma-aminobutyrate hydrolase family protein [Victivallales bacterium]|jgi:putative glutamine amidotransferase
MKKPKQHLSLSGYPRPVIGVSTHFKYGEDYKSSFRDRIQAPELYIRRILDAGGLPLLIPCIEDIEQIRMFVELIDGCVFIGGPDYPASFFNETDAPENKAYLRLRPEFEFILMKEVLAADIPILGICAGEQLLNIALGGKIIQHITNAEAHYDEQYHNCRINPDSLLGKITGKGCLTVNSYHHQAVDPNALGKGLKISAVADDGIVEAIEGVGTVFRLGLQFHAERHRDKNLSELIFRRFVEAAEN